jgi:solute carrier family 6 (neurotransmitter transporter, GABA) member 1
MDFYSASGISLLWVCFFQTIAISWFFGAERFCDCIEEMMDFRPGKFWTICWVFLAPAVMMVSFSYSNCLNLKSAKLVICWLSLQIV